MLAAVGPKSECPDCKHLLNGSISVNQDALPKIGDIALCCYCGCLSIYEDGWKLRGLSDDEVQTLDRLTDEDKDQIFRVRNHLVEALSKRKQESSDTVWN